jgi:Uma2 family endonuclease
MEPMTHAIRRPQKTIEDLLALGDEVRAELIAGEIYMAATPSSRHQDIVLRLASSMLAHLSQHGGGRVFVAPLDVYLPSGDVVEPDVLFVAAERVAMVHDHVHGAPDLLVEVVSPSNPERDRIVKRRLYERNGVSEYWVIEPRSEPRSEPGSGAVEVLRLVDGCYQPAGYLRDGDTLQTPLLPGFTLPLRELFA